MGYRGPYSLGARCVTEAISMALFIFIAESVLANALLSRTKGNAMGWGFIVLGFTFSTAVPAVVLGYISAFCNPAFILSLWVAGYYDGKDFVALGCSDLGGAFVGACLVWLAFAPHFKSAPEPPYQDAQDCMLYARDTFDPVVLRFASYKPESHLKYVRTTLQDFIYYLKPNTYDCGTEVEPECASETPETVVSKPGVVGDFATLQDLMKHRRVTELRDRCKQQAQVTATNVGGKGPLESVVDEQRIRLCLLYDRAIVADQNTKLSVFCTRPAIFSPIWNILVEVVATTALMLCELLLYAQRAQYQPDQQFAFSLVAPFYAGMILFLLVLGLGGPTALSANPARDLGPRLAHWVLPIAGKGASEWYYAWIPVAGPLLGAIAGAGLFRLISKLDHAAQ